MAFLFLILYVVVGLVVWRPVFVSVIKQAIRDNEYSVGDRRGIAGITAIAGVFWPITLVYQLGKLFMTKVILRDTAAEVLFRAEKEQAKLEQQATSTATGTLDGMASFDATERAVLLLQRSMTEEPSVALIEDLREVARKHPANSAEAKLLRSRALRLRQQMIGQSPLRGIPSPEARFRDDVEDWVPVGDGQSVRVRDNLRGSKLNG